jgi:hypothetical protein
MSTFWTINIGVNPVWLHYFASSGVAVIGQRRVPVDRPTAA